MHVPIRRPDILSDDEKCRFGQWLVDDGESVLAGDRVAEMLTAGVLVYVAAPAEGMMLRGNIRHGESVSGDQTLGTIVTDHDELAVD